MKVFFIGLAAVLVLAVLLLPVFLIIFAQPPGYTLLPAFRDAAIIYASFFMCVGALLFIVMTALIALIAFTVRDKITPAIDKVDDTLKTVRGTTTFVSESVVSPIIKVAGAAAGTRAMVQSLMRRKPKKEDKPK
jgi:heme/copper-type cytochrome/quinol oxidase subunit 2